MIVLPGCTVAGLLPNKLGYRWKLPLKIFINVVSLGMLALNAFSWEVRGETLTSPIVAPPWRAIPLLANQSSDVAGLAESDDGDALGSSTLEIVNDVLAYGVLVLSWLLCITFALFFVIFVVFRGAKLQKKQEEAQEKIDTEEALVASLRAHLTARANERRIRSWRVAAATLVQERASRGEIAPERGAAHVLEFTAAPTGAGSRTPGSPGRRAKRRGGSSRRERGAGRAPTLLQRVFKLSADVDAEAVRDLEYRYISCESFSPFDLLPPTSPMVT